MIKLSFIIPVYNVAPYIRKCVESLIRQDFSSYEIILVDDGSTDESSMICDEFVSRIDNMWIDDRYSIQVIHQKNAGLSAARNAGLKAAKGDYVCFVDSDDYWEMNVLGNLMEQVEREQLDVLRFDYQNVNEQYEVFEPNKTPRYIDKCDEVVDGYTYLNFRMGYACYAVLYIIRRKIVPFFTEGIHFEDVEWLPRMMLRAMSVNSTSTIVYNYLIRQGSITQARDNTVKIKNNVEDLMYVIEKYNSYMKQYSKCSWLPNMRSSMVVSVLASVAKYLYSERNMYIKRLYFLGVYPLSIANQGKTYLRKAQLINISPSLAIELLHFKNKI